VKFGQDRYFKTRSEPIGLPGRRYYFFPSSYHRGVIRFSQEYSNMYGELTPLGGGDPIPLLKKQLLVGRRESCDIVLRFANIAG
jgi:hypothetical protein